MTSSHAYTSMPCFFYHLTFDLSVCPKSESLAIFRPSDALYMPLGAKIPRRSRQSHREKFESPKVQAIESSNSGAQDSPQPALVNLEPNGTPADHTIAQDWRYDTINIQKISMTPEVSVKQQDRHVGEGEDSLTNGITIGTGSLTTKGRFHPINEGEENLGWGVVRLYRDAEETPGLYDDVLMNKNRKSRWPHQRDEQDEPFFQDEDCTILCILAVPSYLTPSDFLGFVGEKTRDEVSHFRMIRTERGNRYMVLLKFRSGKKAREWRKEWNGKTFDSMDVCVKAFKFSSTGKY